MPRDLPNILIAGTPGTGKSSLAKSLVDEHQLCGNMMHLDISNYAIENHLCSGQDSTLNSSVLDEDALIDHLEDKFNPASTGGLIFDCHAGDLIPEEWIDRVYVLRTETSVLYDRLAKRGYSKEKLTNNIEAEVFQVILDEARDMFAEKVHELHSNTEDDSKANANSIANFIGSWPCEH